MLAGAARVRRKGDDRDEHGLQALAERHVGLVIQMPVDVEDRLHRGVPGPAGNFLGRRPSRDPQGDRRMPKVVDAQVIELGGMDRRPPDAPAEVGGPQGGPFGPVKTRPSGSGCA